MIAWAGLWFLATAPRQTFRAARALLKITHRPQKGARFDQEGVDPRALLPLTVGISGVLPIAVRID